MKKIITFILILLPVFGAFAGDVATFIDLGFSPDGKTYMFGQYGITDTTLQGYAEIYIVDIASNSFVPGGIFRIQPSAQTANKDGKKLFNTLLATTAEKAKLCNIDHAKEGRPLYVLTAGNFTEKTIAFRDFEQNAAYTVTLNPALYGNGDKIESSFGLTVNKTTGVDNKLTINAGNPNYRRKGVTGYQIRRIISNPAENALVCIVEKKQYDKHGDSIRFMVETFPIQK